MSSLTMPLFCCQMFTDVPRLAIQWTWCSGPSVSASSDNFLLAPETSQWHTRGQIWHQEYTEKMPHERNPLSAMLTVVVLDHAVANVLRKWNSVSSLFALLFSYFSFERFKTFFQVVVTCFQWAGKYNEISFSSQKSKTCIIFQWMACPSMSMTLRWENFRSIAGTVLL